MGKNSNTRFAAPRRGSSLLTGVLVGMVVGLVIAGGVAWYILKTPGPFVENVSHETTRLRADSDEKQVSVSADKSSQVSATSTIASGVDEGKPRFEFYKVLTDKQDMTVAIPKSIDYAETTGNKPASAQPVVSSTVKETYFLQAGSFPNADDAEKLKARLAMLGIEASVQVVNLADKGVWHRVHVGPYKGTEEMNNAWAMLKQNGLSATPMLAR